jgi:uncharacterized membrane protein
VPVSKASRWQLAVLVAILLLGTVLRFVHLGEQSLWLDELSELHTASRSFLSPSSTSACGSSP